MSLRSQAFSALVVLFVSLGVVFVAAGEIGFQTDVFLPGQPTPTAVPPTAASVPEPSADNWVDSPTTPNQYAYVGEYDGQAFIQVGTLILADFITSNQFTAPPEDTPFKLLDLQAQLRDRFVTQYSIADESITGPLMEIIGGVPLAITSFVIEAETLPDGTTEPGAGLILAWAERSGELVRMELNFEGDYTETLRADWRAWLEANAGEFVGLETAEEPAADDDAGDDAGDDATDDAAEEPAAEDDAETDDSAAGETESE